MPWNLQVHGVQLHLPQGALGTWLQAHRAAAPGFGSVAFVKFPLLCPWWSEPSEALLQGRSAEALLHQFTSYEVGAVWERMEKAQCPPGHPWGVPHCPPAHSPPGQEAQGSPTSHCFEVVTVSPKEGLGLKVWCSGQESWQQLGARRQQQAGGFLPAAVGACLLVSRKTKVKTAFS